MKKSLKVFIVSLIACLATFIFVGCKENGSWKVENRIYLDYKNEVIAETVDERGGKNITVYDKIIEMKEGDVLPFYLETEKGVGAISATRFRSENEKCGLLCSVEQKIGEQWEVISKNKMPIIEASGEYRLIAEYKNKYSYDFYMRHWKKENTVNEKAIEEAYMEVYFSVLVVEA